jgi:hypothetical protein
VSLVVVTSRFSGGGKTGVAAAIARHYAYLGRPVRLVRAEGPEGERPAEDAAYFASLAFVPGSPASPLAPAAITDPGGTAIVVVEAGFSSFAGLAAAEVVLVERGAPPASLPDGLAPAAIVATDVPVGSPAASPIGGIPMAVIAEDRRLAGFSVAEARTLLNAEVIVEGDEQDSTCDHLVIAPIASDAGQPYFRRFSSKAVVVRFDKTDMHLAAMQADPACLILTGGRAPSDYLFDAAQAQGVPVLLSRTDTENTVIALEGIFDRTRFQGEAKLDRMCELLERTPLFAALSL